MNALGVSPGEPEESKEQKVRYNLNCLWVRKWLKGRWLEHRTMEISETGYLRTLAFRGIMNSKFNESLFTPSNISVSSKQVLAIFDDGQGVRFKVAPVVKGFYSPAVRGGAVA